VKEHYDTSDLVMALLELGATVTRTTLENIPHRNTWGEKAEVMAATSPNLKIVRNINTITIKRMRGKAEVNPELYGYEYLFKLGDTIVLKQK